MNYQPKSQEFVKNLSEFFKRDLISIPLIKKYPHQLFNQRCGIKASTLELDTSAYPNIEYIAGNRLSVYPVNPHDHVESILKHLIDDISGTPGTSNGTANIKKRIKLSDPWAKFVQLNGRDSVRMALSYLYDITTAPSRELVRVMAEYCSNKEHKVRLIAISKTDESWEKWICQSLRTLKSTLDEFSSCCISAKSLFSELTLQQPRQYSISSIKSNKRFRTEIIVFQHKFTTKQIAYSLQQIKEREYSIRDQQDSNNQTPKSPMPIGSTGTLQVHPTTVHINHDDTGSHRSTSSVRSLRNVVPYGLSPISTQQVKKVPAYSGPLMSLYASSSKIGSKGVQSGINSYRQSQISLQGKELIPQQAAKAIKSSTNSLVSGSQEKQYDGLCSSYLLSLNVNDYIVCEFVENPRFTLKGNRERPIMMIGQDVGVIAYRPFWQQRALEHDRAQIFYTLFKDLSPKKFGDMQLVCITGNRCKIEDLFKREINATITNKIISSVSYVNKSHLLNILDSAAAGSESGRLADAKQQQQQADNNGQNKVPIESKELVDLGKRISKLLIENNGCLYTCCDPQMTQAIEILTVESITRNHGMAKDRVMALLPTLKGRKVNDKDNNNKFLFTLENPFEKAQIVQEVYDSSI